MDMRRTGSNMRKRSSSRGFLQTHQKQQHSGADAMELAKQKSLVHQVRQEAQIEARGYVPAKLDALQRPETPAQPRKLLNEETAHRPPSSYGLKEVTDGPTRDFVSKVNLSNASTAAHSNAKQQQQFDIKSLQRKIENQRKPVLPSIEKIKEQASAGVQKIGTVPMSSIKNVQQQKKTQPVKASILTSAPKLEEKKSGGISQKPVPEEFKDLVNQDSMQEQQMKMRQTMEKFKQQQEVIHAKKQQSEEEEDDDFCVEEDMGDDLEDYFASQIMQDIQGSQQKEQEEGDPYEKAMRIISQGISQIDQTEPSEPVHDDDDAAAYLLDSNPEGLTLYEQEYDDVITFIGILCRDKNTAENQELLEIAGKIWNLSSDFKMQNQITQEKCCIETLFKGTQALLDVKHIQACLRLSSTGIHIYFNLFEQMLNLTKNQISFSTHISEDALRQFTGLNNIVKVLFKYSKIDEYDKVFIQEDQTLEMMTQIVSKLFAGPEYEKLCNLCQRKIKDSVYVGNTDNIWDMIIYLMGAFKNLTMKQEIVSLILKHDFCKTLHKVLVKCYQKDFSGANMQVKADKKPQLVVQVSAVLRYIANNNENYDQIIESRVIPDMVSCLKEYYSNHKELTFNISRFLSKMSSDFDCCAQIAKTDPYSALIGILRVYGQEGVATKKDFMAILNRISFVLGNLTTHFQGSRHAIGEDREVFGQLLNLTNRLFNPLFDQAITKTKKPQQQGDQVEELLTKLIRVVANVATEESLFPILIKHKKKELQEFIQLVVKSLEMMSLERNEEYILNSVSCLTNILFYDIPQENKEEELISQKSREQIFRFVSPFIYTSQNDEVQIETVRVLSNLSRHLHMCRTFANLEKEKGEEEGSFADVLLLLVQNNLRELVYYGIGILINVSLHKDCRVAILSRPFIDKLTNVVRDCNIEDMDLAKSAIKALLNLTAETTYWSEEQIKELDAQLLSIGEELDSIMDVASESDMVEITAYRQLINDLVNNLPEAMHECPQEGCKRKFKTKDEMQKHFERRHQ